jgi:hypothetical protein
MFTEICFDEARTYFSFIKKVYIDDDLTKEERETQKKLRELAREERDRGKRVKIGYRKIQINGDWFRWDKRQEKLKKIC